MTSKRRHAPARENEPVRVAVIGGGCAAMAAAFELSRPEHRGKYEVTVYQAGHRLGGKGASGRGTHGRIEEHGLHLWMGYYENAFRLMRQCYEELGRDPRSCPIADIEGAFEHASAVGLTEQEGESFRPWLALFPTSSEMPGESFPGRGPFTVTGYLVRAAELLVELMRSAGDPRDPRDPRRRHEDEEALSEERLADAVDRVLKYGQLAGTAAILEAGETLYRALAALLPLRGARPDEDHPLLALCDALASAARRQLEVIVEADRELCRVWEVVDILLAMTRGLLRERVALRPEGLDFLDEHDYRDWLRSHGASERSLGGAFLRGIYDLLFAYEGGDPKRPRFAAGVAVRGTLRMFFTYRGALFFRMNAGMGDVVFAPLFEVMRDRGVRFAFFHRLRDVRLAPEASVPPGEEPWVTALDIDVQAEVKGRKGYDPLVPVGGLPCWPSKPKFKLLEGGDELAAEGADFESHTDAHCARKLTLEVGRDFDFVILGIGLGAIPHVAPELVARSGRVREMVARVGTVATQAFQVWMSAGMRSLGWHGGRTTVSAFVEPFDTWADMSHLLSRERWPRAPKDSNNAPPRSIAYFCSVLPEGPGGLDARREEVRQGALEFLRRDVRALWPRAVDKRGRFRWDLLAGSEESGEARFDSQYWTANIHPSDRYVMALPGTVKYRISPLDPGLSNLTFAGDWTASGLNSGCVESAVMSGMLAAHAISGYPALEEIIGYDHP